jgi:hypothetical protein
MIAEERMLEVAHVEQGLSLTVDGLYNKLTPMLQL